MLRREVGYFKIGPMLSKDIGASHAIRAVKGWGGDVFFDGILGQANYCKTTIYGRSLERTIDATIKIAETIVGLEVSMFSIHSILDFNLIKAVADNKGPALLIAKVPPIYSSESKIEIINFATTAMTAGCDGFMCHPAEMKIFKDISKFDDMQYVLSEVYPLWYNDIADRSITMTPAEAAYYNVNCMIIGDPIINPPNEIGNPGNAVDEIAKEIISLVR
jgi:orotidine-5'-phosphate decarboxylase